MVKKYVIYISVMSVTYSPHINTAVKGVSLCDIADTMLNMT